ncbi:MAG: DUF998 domain-containing protein [Actinomycetes bacterium]
MTSVAWWGGASSVAAPVLLVGGWSVAASRQEPPFDSVTGTISALAAHGADDRWLMTGALLGVGLCHMVTAAALRPGRRPGRWVLAAGGLATVGVALAPLPADSSRSITHAVFATTAFVSLAAWPAFADRSGSEVCWGLRTTVARLASAALITLVAWFFVTSVVGGPDVGRAERVAAAAQSVWPAVVVWSALAAQRRERV